MISGYENRGRSRRSVFLTTDRELRPFGTSKSSWTAHAFLVAGFVAVALMIVLSYIAITIQDPGPTTIGPEPNSSELNIPTLSPPFGGQGHPFDTIDQRQITKVITIPTTSPTPVLKQAEITARMDAATAAGNARLASIQAAYHAWAIPARPDLVAVATNVKSAGLKGDGATDDTAALQALLNRLPAGSAVYFPPARYLINGPITITKPFTLFGEPGTAFECPDAAPCVFSINKKGSSTSPMDGMTITGIVIEGPGIGTSPAIFGGYYLQNARFSYVKFHNIGHAAIEMMTCTDVIVEDCVFDNVYRDGYGYGVAISDHSDRITVRDNFFVTKGRHGVTTGTSNSATIQPEEYVRSVTVENNYFEYMTQGAGDAHVWTTGPYTIRGNVMNHCFVDVGIHGGTAVVTDNLFINNPYRSVVLSNDEVDQAEGSAKIDLVERNTFINVSRAVMGANSNIIIQDNIAQGTNTREGIYLYGTITPEIAVVKGNILERFTKPLYQSARNPHLSNADNIIKMWGLWGYLRD
jgi:hypothetical protein